MPAAETLPRSASLPLAASHCLALPRTASHCLATSLLHCLTLDCPPCALHVPSASRSSLLSLPSPSARRPLTPAAVLPKTVVPLLCGAAAADPPVPARAVLRQAPRPLPPPLPPPFPTAFSTAFSTAFPAAFSHRLFHRLSHSLSTTLSLPSHRFATAFVPTAFAHRPSQVTPNNPKDGAQASTRTGSRRSTSSPRCSPRQSSTHQTPNQLISSPYKNTQINLSATNLQINSLPRLASPLPSHVLPLSSPGRADEQRSTSPRPQPARLLFLV